MKGSEVFVRSLSWVLSRSPACSQSASSLCTEQQPPAPKPLFLVREFLGSWAPHESKNSTSDLPFLWEESAWSIEGKGGAPAVRWTRPSSPFHSSMLAAVKILCVLCRTGLGLARLFWCCQARLDLRTLCCCLNVSALLGAGMFENTVLGACVFNSLQASGFMVIPGV